MSKWWRHGFWNTFEQLITRGSDALVSFVLLWTLTPELFSKLAIAQAWCAPLLLLFLCPEGVIYRKYATWSENGPNELASRIRAFRLWGFGKLQLALLISLFYAIVTRGGGDKFWAMVWAFSLVLGPQISGGDREFLRMSLRLRALSFLSVFQKILLVALTLLASFLARDEIKYLALAALISTLSGGVIAYLISRRTLLRMGAQNEYLLGKRGPTPLETLNETLREFSIWQHISGVITGWIQTMDLFFLGITPGHIRWLGLYGAVLKLCNFSNAIPLAFSNLFSVWVGQASQSDDRIRTERKRVVQMSFWLLGISLIQASFLLLLSPLLLQFLSHGRWTDIEIELMSNWLQWILIGAVIFQSGLLMGSWLTLRFSVARLFWKVSLPWLGCSLLIYFISAKLGGFDLAAKANPAVGACYLLCLWFFVKMERVST